MATQTLPHPRTDRHTALNVVLWVLQLGVVYTFVKAAIPKLTGDATAVQGFEAIGLGQWFRYFTGSLEMIGSTALLIPGAAGYGALLLSTVMIGAIFMHLAVIGGSPLLAIIMLAANLVIAWGRLWRRI
jgi:putative oxidoreductase